MKEGSTVTLSLKNNYENRHILLTGGTGFVGKVLLSMLLQYLPGCDRIYVLVRANNSHAAKDRFIHLIETSPAFSSLQNQYGKELKPLLDKKITIIQGDITAPYLGIDPAIAKNLYKVLDLVIHVAGLVDFSPNVQLALDINVTGTINTADFVSACDHAALAYISTCYVAGNKNGYVEEDLVPQKAPNDAFFDVENEITLLKQLIHDVVDQHISHDHKKRAGLKKALKKLGHDRATFWGWTNTYTYTKALAERILATRYTQLRFTIIRPSIIESALEYPAIGWNEGFNTCGPYCYIAGSWYPYVIYKDKQIMDIIPIDFVCNAILAICGALLENKHSKIYQIASSNTNPLFFKDLTKYTRAWHRHMLYKTEKSWVKKYFRCFKALKTIGPDSFVAPRNLINIISKVNHKIKKSRFYHWRFMSSPLKKLSRRLKSIEGALYYINIVHSTYQPFTYDNQYLFACEALQKLFIAEPEFKYDIKNIRWKDYWLNAQMPGLNRWVFPSIRGKKENKIMVNNGMATND